MILGDGAVRVLMIAAPLTPLLLALAGVKGGVRRYLPDLLPFAPLPALLAALLVPDGASVLSPDPLRLTLVMETPGAVLLGASAVLWCAAGVFLRGYFTPGQRLRGLSIWWLLTMSGSLGVFLVGDLASFYLTFALASLPAWGLAADEDTPRGRRAGRVYLAMTLVGEACLLFAFVMLAADGPVANPLIRDAVAAVPDSAGRAVIVLLLVLGFGLKIGLVPLHVWMPLVYRAAPAPAAAVLSGIVVKAGVIGLIRFLPFEDGLRIWGDVLVGAGLFSAYFGVLVGLTQKDARVVLAYSSVSQMGVLAAVGGAALASADAAGPLVGAFYAANHVLLKGAMFLAVGVLDRAGRSRRRGALLVAALLGLSLAGLPFTGGALAKYAIKPVFGEGIAAVLVTVSAAGTAALMLHFVACLAARAAPVQSNGLPDRMRLSFLVLSVLALVLPYTLFTAVTGLPFGVAFTPAALVKALWPVLLGAALAFGVARVARRLPQVPPGDVLVVVERLGPRLRPLGRGLDRLDLVLGQWPVASLLLVAIALGLGLLFVA